MSKQINDISVPLNKDELNLLGSALRHYRDHMSNLSDGYKTWSGQTAHDKIVESYRLHSYINEYMRELESLND